MNFLRPKSPWISISLVALSLSVSSCRATKEANVAEVKSPIVDSSESEGTYSRPDDFLTIDQLAEMTDAELFSLIRDRGAFQKCIPETKSVGKPGRIDDSRIQKNNATRVIFAHLFKVLGTKNSQEVADIVWQGKVFKRDPGCKTGTGTNRIGEGHLITMTNRTFLRDQFFVEQRFDDANERAFLKALGENKVGVNLVELNYSDPKNDPFHAGRNFGVRDVMVPILQPDNTVIYIGRAYAGTWETAKRFRSDGLLAWFFLDFTQRALDAE